MEFDREELENALGLLGVHLDEQKIAPIHLVVSGGAAILSRKIVERTTHDVDVVAQRGIVDGELIPSWPLPEDFKKAVEEIAVEVGFHRAWINATTSLMMIRLEELPRSLWTDMETHSFGSRLQVSFIGREGLVHLKLWAAASRDVKRDRVDLSALSPSAEEISKAEQWLKDNELLNAPQWGKFYDLTRKGEG